LAGLQIPQGSNKLAVQKMFRTLLARYSCSASIKLTVMSARAAVKILPLPRSLVLQPFREGLRFGIHAGNKQVALLNCSSPRSWFNILPGHRLAKHLC